MCVRLKKSWDIRSGLITSRQSVFRVTVIAKVGLFHGNRGKHQMIFPRFLDLMKVIVSFLVNLSFFFGRIGPKVKIRGKAMGLPFLEQFEGYLTVYPCISH
jgi:hypothetical protein